MQIGHGRRLSKAKRGLYDGIVRLTTVDGDILAGRIDVGAVGDEGCRAKVHGRQPRGGAACVVVLVQLDVAVGLAGRDVPRTCPHDHCWHSWQNGTQTPGIWLCVLLVLVLKSSRKSRPVRKIILAMIIISAHRSS